MTESEILELLRRSDKEKELDSLAEKIAFLLSETVDDKERLKIIRVGLDRAVSI